MQALADERLTIEAFLDLAEGASERMELFEGRVVGMAGGTVRHARVARQILSALEARLRGTGCEAFGSDLAIRTGPNSVRFPDVGIHCGLGSEPVDEKRVLDAPRVLMEVLSPSTQGHDRAVKLIEYKALPSVDTVVLIQPGTRQCDLHERGSGNEWRSVTHLPGAPLTLRDPAVTLTADEIFGEP